MIRYYSKHYKPFLIGSGVVVVFLFFYVQKTAFGLYSELVREDAERLSKFSARTTSRIEVNPQKIEGQLATSRSVFMGSNQLAMVASLSDLNRIFPELASRLDEGELSVKPSLFIKKFRGLFKVPNYVLVQKVETAGFGSFYSFYFNAGSEPDGRLDQKLNEKVRPALFFSFTLIALLFFWQLRQLSLLHSTASKMAEWAEQLNPKQNSEPLPKFSSPRFNHIAFTINRSLATFSDALEKEQSFARYTSHELRTPIAVLSANIELLEVMMQDLSPREKRILQRMEIAISDMKYQMEALLWASKETDGEIEFECIELEPLLRKVVSDNSYLLQNKSISVQIDVNGASVQSHQILLTIILNNLVRNAYQNTNIGSVDIVYSDQSLSIKNVDSQNSPQRQEESFGIGLMLVKKIAQKLRVEFVLNKIKGGREAILIFPSTPMLESEPEKSIAD